MANEDQEKSSDTSSSNKDRVLVLDSVNGASKMKPAMSGSKPAQKGKEK